jgi:hypothetical protein
MSNNETRNRRARHFKLSKGMNMNSNQKRGQGSKERDRESVGKQGERDRESASRQSGDQGSRSGPGTQGGTHEQHVEAGRQSHKNDDRNNTARQSGNKQSGAPGSGGKSDSNR